MARSQPGRPNLLFDLDGTLTDPRRGIVACIKHALVSLDQAVPEHAALERFIGPPLREVFRELLPATLGEASVEAAVTAYRDRFASVGMFENAVFEGIPEALARLTERGARLFVATSKAQVFAERILEHFELARYFAAVYGAELDGRRSNKGELIAYALSAEGLAADATVMIGDRRHDVIGALENGVFPAGVLWGYGSEQELEHAGAKRLIAAPAELIRLLD